MTDPFAPLDDHARPIREPDKDGDCIMPAPEDAPTPAMRHPDLGSPVRVWEYKDMLGGRLGFAARFEQNGQKEIRYWTLWRKDGRLRWRCKHWPRPKPLYGLDRLAARPGMPVVVCEGEKATDAAALLMPNYVAVCWPGGASAPQIARWDALADRDVILWPDNDQPGWKAMAAVVSILRTVRVRRIRLINRELLATRVPLDKGDDASDLVSRDGWDVAMMLSFLVMPDALVEPPETVDDKGAAHRHMVDSVQAYLERLNLTSDAVGRWRRDGTYAKGVNSVLVAKDFSFDYRYLKPIDTRRAVEIVERFGREQAAKRFAEIKAKILNKPVSDSGQIALARFIYAITGHQDEEVLWALLHWMWLVKRSVAGMPRAYDLMPVLYGTKQGSGKSTAFRRLASPWAELVQPINEEVLTDNRRATELERFAVGAWDEMEGAGKADIEALKNTITCESKAYRPMGTNESAHAVRMMCFLGTSNKPVEAMVRDTTGARRFFQIDAQDVIDHEAVNGIDYESLWTAISENDKSPLASADMRDAVLTWQGRSRGRDGISLYVEWDDLGQITGFQPKPGVPAVTVATYQSDRGFTADELRHRYHYWCQTMGEQPISGQAFGQRIKEEGWERRQRRIGGKSTWRYFRATDPHQAVTDDEDDGR